MPEHRTPVKDLGRLLLGHAARFRGRELQDVATRALRASGGENAWVVSVVNTSLRARQAVDHALRLAPRRGLSRLRYPFSAAHHTATPPRTLSLLCPTRERVGNVERFLDSVARTAAAPGRIEALFYVDDDDPQLPAYHELFEHARWRYGRIGRCALHVGAPVGVPHAWNHLARNAAGDVLMMANDDQLYIDYGWDTALDARVTELSALHPDGVLCLYFDDGQYPEGGCDFPMVTRPWYGTLGYFTPTIFQQWEVEKWVFDIADRLHRLYPVPGVLVEHRHYQDYKAPFDATYQRHRMTREKSFADHALFLRTEPDREAETDRLRAVIARAGNTPDADHADHADHAVHDAETFWFTGLLRESHAKLLAELDDAPGPAAGAVLFADGSWTAAAYRTHPLATALLASIPEATLDSGRADLLVVPPGASHHHPAATADPASGSDAGLRVLFGLRVPDAAQLRVGDGPVPWGTGQCLVHDTAAPSTLRNDGTEPLAALTFVVPRPAPGE
ncbi:aspartyl/asparaginyl beta-hydroxylase domain-containing protein [Streptomyces mobaraensis NBRC 13819 = DSM 40847]|uniref:Aspartyl/Asparaginyl beta-hydroxylase n=1 Tax=Streptomyces mobaraensis (strain ATCC 29032 / DSM 40847 / JCM 4168 / NBRC 13819 / NCIMB 11159 / IPCR 16-22) TaxID=1223523 RepID=M3ASD7_STRM1|nr:aspartyl/asparaginyl beta-hydroxylase domain-containing protein [Streptomyces mobaraensis]EME96502.1 aspartyl/Asparaginyl beta-hydroxylase [Streptomyces mobaraensis NBRC 13819 = DSM 40847]QTT72094.1 aspartyl/asparaginyl beta-hydroxylase domain-containing protein [Streptomyces mobaraensis NBRC 13819 = DSM 40847]